MTDQGVNAPAGACRADAVDGTSADWSPGLPTARFRDRLTQMATNRGLAVIACDPAYTSKWGAEHWLGVLQEISPVASGHHAAALVIGRRRARTASTATGEGVARTPPVDGEQRAADPAVRAAPAPAGLSGQRSKEPEAPRPEGSHIGGARPPPASGHPPGDQVAQDRSATCHRAHRLTLKDVDELGTVPR